MYWMDNNGLKNNDDENMLHSPISMIALEYLGKINMKIGISTTKKIEINNNNRHFNNIDVLVK